MPSSGPTNVSALATASTSMLVRWNDIPETDRNGLVLGYKVGIYPFVLSWQAAFCPTPPSNLMPPIILDQACVSQSVSAQPTKPYSYAKPQVYLAISGHSLLGISHLWALSPHLCLCRSFSPGPLVSKSGLFEVQ